MSIFIPVVSEVTITPTASAPVEIRAMAASPLILPLSLIRKSRNAATITTGSEK